MSKTCPHCGKLNSIHETNCTNCGTPLPQSGEKIIGYIQPKSKQSVTITFIVIAIVLIAGIVGISIKQNQEILRTSSVNVVPFKIKFFNRHNRLVMVRYIKGKSRTSKNGYATGTMVVTKQLKATHGEVVSYEDSRAKRTLVIHSSPKMTFYYNTRYGKFNDFGRCRITGYPQIKKFQMIKLDSGTH